MISLLVLASIYLGFTVLGISDSMLGTAWPSMNTEYLTAVSSVGIISMIISGGKMAACLTASRITRRYGEAVIFGISLIAMALSMIGIFSVHRFPMLLLMSIPLGLGSGFVDVIPCSYVAIHYKSRYNSWLQCMWSIGASLGPIIMGTAISSSHGWSTGYLAAATLTGIAAAFVLFTLPFWVRAGVWSTPPADFSNAETVKSAKPVSFKDILLSPQAVSTMLCFFFYSSVQQTANLWAGSYLTSYRGLASGQAAAFVSMLFIGVTLSRFVCGFLTIRFSDNQIVRFGCLLILIGCFILAFLPGTTCSLGLLFVGFGCAPVYPCMLHMTASVYGSDKSPAIISAEIAFSFAGESLMPPLFGLIADYLHIGLFPLFLFVSLIFMTLFEEKTAKQSVK